MVWVWVVNKSEKNVLEAKGWKQPNLQTLKYGWTQRNNINSVAKWVTVESYNRVGIEKEIWIFKLNYSTHKVAIDLFWQKSKLDKNK